MRGTLLTILLALSSPFLVRAQVVVFEQVTYLDVEKGRSVEDATVVVEDGKITRLSRRRVQVLEGATVIDGTGKYLIPGLVDSHIHMFQSGSLYARPDVIDMSAMKPYDEEITWVREQADDLFRRYMRQGIITVMDVGGPFTNFDIKEEFEGVVTAPYYLTTGPLISSYQPEAFQISDPPIMLINTPEEARELVRRQAERNPDFIKIWYIVFQGRTPESYLPVVEATMEEAAKHGLPVAVHATGLAEAKLAVKAGAKFLVHSVREPIDQEFIDLLLANEVVLDPTLIVSRKYAETFAQVGELSQTDFEWANPYTVGSFMDLRIHPDTAMVAQYLTVGQNRLALLDGEGSATEVEAENLRKLVDAGVFIATGTDAGNIGTLHATSFYHELAAMQQAGLDNWQILKASTLSPAEVVSESHLWGSIAEGKRADMVLLESDPIASLEALKQVDLVMKGGQLIDPDTLLPDTPEILAQRQLNAYNAGDIDAFLEPYSDSVKIYQMPASEPYVVGKENIRPRYASMFENVPELHCEVVDRIVVGNTVIDQERITGLPDGSIGRAIAIYKMAQGKIVEVHFWRPEDYDPGQ
ncbi:MAG: amidohydrolase family protein [Bacteroidota bacterium]